MDPFFVRTATPDDIPAIAELLAETWRDTYVEWFGAEKVEAIIADWHSPAALARKIALPNGEMLVADDGAQMGGVAFASIDRDTKTVTLHQLYVHPRFHRRGIGQALFAEMETCFDDADRMVLEVEPRNQGAIAFYEAHGFLRGGIAEHCGQAGSGMQALAMEKALNC
ncbi:MAG: GNAT family N-acetyltransferase [Rhizobiaceae bacterium]|jgi:ribosomal protein S18 acetylase RimI-like enzyme|nr:GNAT family N-acetyltransferase [Rhizobiaceae bacterium]